MPNRKKNVEPLQSNGNAAKPIVSGRAKRKPKPRHWLFTLHWWNPLIYIGIVIYFFVSLWSGGIKEWWQETVGLFKNYDWS